MEIVEGRYYKQKDVKDGYGAGTVVRVMEYSYGRVNFKVISPQNLEDSVKQGDTYNNFTTGFNFWFKPYSKNKKVRRLE